MWPATTIVGLLLPRIPAGELLVFPLYFFHFPFFSRLLHYSPVFSSTGTSENAVPCPRAALKPRTPSSCQMFGLLSVFFIVLSRLLFGSVPLLLPSSWFSSSRSSRSSLSSIFAIRSHFFFPHLSTSITTVSSSTISHFAPPNIPTQHPTQHGLRARLLKGH